MKYEEFAKLDTTTRPPSLAVICVFCGVKMRDSQTEDATGQCWKCYYRILNDHLRSQRRSNNFLFASEP
jgi:DNA-directed RNA polymerase subunit RPC12/RpoP